MAPKNTKTKFYPKKMRAKHFSRMLAVQALYAAEMQKQSVDFNRIILDVIEVNGIDIKGELIFDKLLLKELTEKLLEQLPQIDQAISLYLSEEWRVERLPSLLRSILRIGAFELRYNKKASSAIIINEYIEIAKFFHHDGERGFVNSILDKLSKDEQWIS